MSDSGRKIRVQLVGFAEVLKAGDGIFGLIFPDFPKNPGLRDGDWEVQSVLGTVAERKQLSADPGMAPY